MNKNYALKIRCDQNLEFNEATSCIIWDDANELLYAFEPNQYREGNLDLPAMIRCIEYDKIVEITGFYAKEDFASQFDTFISKGLTNEETKNAMIQEIFDFSDIRMYKDGDKQDPAVMHKANPLFDRPTATNVIPLAKKNNDDNG